MMSYRYDKQRQVRKRWYIFGTIFLLIALFTPIYSWFFDMLEKPFEKNWSDRIALEVESKNIFQSFYNKQRIIDENQTLKEDVRRLEIDNLRTRYLSEELEKNLLLQELTNIVPAHVVRRDIYGSSDIFLINQGDDTGLAVGDKVLNYNKVLIGYISELYDTSSEVTLFSHVDETRNGILFPHDITLNVEGHGNGTFKINAPREINIVENDIFYDLENPGFIIGIVREVVFDARDPFKQVYLSYPMSLNEINLVGIKKSTQIN
ncbi:MAG: hypothetical protein ACI870_000054 [Crocinitomicaceae bacterium]|jgi:hypothetical protein